MTGSSLRGLYTLSLFSWVSERFHFKQLEPVYIKVFIYITLETISAGKIASDAVPPIKFWHVI